MELVHCKELLQVDLLLDWISLDLIESIRWVHFGLDRKETSQLTDIISPQEALHGPGLLRV